MHVLIYQDASKLEHAQNAAAVLEPNTHPVPQLESSRVSSAKTFSNSDVKQAIAPRTGAADGAAKEKRYAKTLRLTSDQLVKRFAQ
jgi:hypothetical protein